MSNKPLVTVVMNCFNGEKYLREAINSVIAQTYQNWELVFWDNQSSDGSAEIVRSYNDSRLRYFRAPTHTLLYEARNLAIAESRGEIIGFLDVDDWWTPDKLEKQVALFSDPQVGIVCGNYWVVSERKGKKWIALKKPAPTGKVLDDLLKYYFVGLPTLMVRKQALASLDHPCNPRYHIMGDYDLVIRLASTWKLAYVHDVVAFYRLHGSNESAKHRGRLVEEMEEWLKEMRSYSSISSSPNFRVPKSLAVYWRGIHRVLEADRGAGIKLARALPWGKLKLRLLAASMLPLGVAKRLTN